MIEILQYPDEMLLKVSRELEDYADDNMLIQAFIKNVWELAHGTRFQGISAVQMGIPIRLMAVVWGAELRFLINPVIVKKSPDTHYFREGCLSIDHGRSFYDVQRYKRIKIKAFLPDWTPITMKGSDIYGASIQHEIDHMDGILINSKGTFYHTY